MLHGINRGVNTTPISRKGEVKVKDNKKFAISMLKRTLLTKKMSKMKLSKGSQQNKCKRF